MSQIIYPITHLPPVIDIGKQTEKGVTRIGFDVHEWLDDWPGMAFSVQPTRPGETESYFAASEMVGSVVFWLVGAVDTEKPGSGTVEVLGVTEDERKLSFMCRTSIANTNTATVAEIPEPNQPWVDQVILAGEGSKKSALTASQAAQVASQAASDAGQHSANADAQAASAAKSAANAAQSATESYQSFRSASGAASTAVQSATEAAKAQANAEGHAAIAGNKAQEAENSAADAATSAENAKKAAETITGTSTSLQQLVTDADGVVKWEDRMAYKIKRVKRTTCLPSDEWTHSDEGYSVGMSEWAEPLRTGENYIVEYNGAPYTCTAIADGSIIVLGGNGYPFELIYNPPSLPMLFPTDGSVPSSVAVYKDKVVEYKKTIDPELLPEGIGGGGAGLPETADPLKQLVTDADGNVAWEDRLAYKTMAEVENLAATELVSMGDEGFALTTPWAADVVAGAAYTVTYNGTDYECMAVDYAALVPDAGVPEGGCMLGNLAAMGMEGVEGSNADATFVLLTMPNACAADVGAYGQFIPLDGATTATITVSSEAETVKTIDPKYLPPVESMFNVHTTATMYHTTTGFDFSAFDKTYAEMAAAYKAGSHVRIVCTMYNNGAKMGDLIGEVVTTINSNLDMTEQRENPTLCIRMPMGVTVANTNVHFWLGEGENGEIVSKLMSA